MDATPLKSSRPAAARGVALIEVLVSLLIFVIGLLGVIGLQARAVQYTVQAEDRSRAALLTSDLVAQMWGQQTTGLSSATLTAWNTRVSAALPEAETTVTTTSGVTTITVKWKAVNASSGDAAQHKYVTQVAIP